MKKNTQVAMNPGIHRTNLRVEAPTPGSSAQPQDRVPNPRVQPPDPRVAAPAPQTLAKRLVPKPAFH